MQSKLTKNNYKIDEAKKKKSFDLCFVRSFRVGIFNKPQHVESYMKIEKNFKVSMLVFNVKMKA